MLILGIKKMPKGRERQGKMGEKTAKAGSIEAGVLLMRSERKMPLFILHYR